MCIFVIYHCDFYGYLAAVICRIGTMWSATKLVLFLEMIYYTVFVFLCICIHLSIFGLRNTNYLPLSSTSRCLLFFFLFSLHSHNNYKHEWIYRLSILLNRWLATFFSPISSKREEKKTPHMVCGYCGRTAQNIIWMKICWLPKLVVALSI